MSKALEYGMVALFSAGAVAAIGPVVSRVANGEFLLQARAGNAVNVTAMPPGGLATVLSIWPVEPTVSCQDAATKPKS